MKLTDPRAKPGLSEPTAKPGLGEPSAKPAKEQRFTGHPVSPGIGIGPVFEAVEPELIIPKVTIGIEGIAAETARLD